MDRLRYEEHPVPVDLRDVLRCVWTLEGDARTASGEADPVVPDGCAELIVHHGAPYEEWEDGRWTPQPRVFLYGQLTRIIRLRPTGPSGVMGLRFEPHGAAAFLGAAMHRFTDRKATLDELTGADREALEERLLAPGDAATRMAVLLDVLREWRRNGDPAAERPVTELLRAIAERGGAEPVTPLKADGAWSVRKAERRFQAVVGLRPKVFARIVRLRRIIGLMRDDPQASLAALAYEAGYFDQAHFNREFKAFTGKSPRDHFGHGAILPEYFTGVP